MLEVDVPVFDDRRRVAIEFRPLARRTEPVVTVDGPVRSRHRFANGSLCMWYPPDPAERRWIHDDGLLALVDRIRTHLWQEERWRRTGVWVGDEVPHERLEDAA